jgi:cellulose synthase/poly-beta-1,6-N-acetylglucosamine synthase-like glycosyltransferase
MAWYQRFEYAIGHWLQKATEHVMGCVLCSPGCFSLFRAKALMDDNVMNKYTTKSENPQDFVQYDQGEDRWLCTLLLQRGWRVEYSAASDAFTGNQLTTCIRALSAHSAAEFNISPGRWQHVWLVAITIQPSKNYYISRGRVIHISRTKRVVKVLHKPISRPFCSRYKE